MKSKRVERRRDAARLRKIVQEVARKFIARWFEMRADRAAKDRV